jgi:predicted nucleic acid-binding protein
VIVVDASAMLEVLLNRPSGERVAQRLLDPLEVLHAPHLIDLEIAQALRRYQAAGEMRPQRARQALLAFVQMPLERHPHWPFLARIWELRRNVTAYDAAYVVLAEALDAPLLTCDRALARAPGHRAVVELMDAEG